MEINKRKRAFSPGEGPLHFAAVRATPARSSRSYRHARAFSRTPGGAYAASYGYGESASGNHQIRYVVRVRSIYPISTTAGRLLSTVRADPVSSTVPSARIGRVPATAWA